MKALPLILKNFYLKIDLFLLRRLIGQQFKLLNMILKPIATYFMQ